ncbi:hypothetical protein L916_07951 [Phytophthora nicotianae]|uniref:WLGC domain-containing protein n=3 Tax=Phytophthora nicotianae TaxID=4792 RepID=W2J3H9_PHYNI|nr:hypothetical protein L916_07951 [Phytophthora nicotianae]
MPASPLMESGMPTDQISSIAGTSSAWQHCGDVEMHSPSDGSSKTHASQLFNVSVTSFPGPLLSTLHSTPLKTLKSRRNIHPELSPGALQGPSKRMPARKRELQVDPNKFSRFVVIFMKSLVGAMALLCFVWTIWLILLTIKPNETVNWVMKTETFDDGSFWLMVDPPIEMASLSVCGFLLVAIGYASVFVKVIQQPKHTRLVRHASRLESMTTNLRKDIISSASKQRENKVTTVLAHSVLLLVKDDSVAVKIVRVWIKFADLAIESLILYQILEEGSPSLLVAVFSTIVGMNALSCALMMFLPNDQTGLSEIIVDTLFDFLVAVGYPILMVIYCLSTFGLDHAKIAINLKVFPAGYFERNASVIADPVQTDIIYKTLKSLQIFTLLDFTLRVGVHVVFSYRLSRVADLIRDSSRRPARLYPKRHFLCTMALVVFAVILAIFVQKSMWTSAMACQRHLECAVKAHRWIIVDQDSMTQCPCLVLIDGDLAPKTFESWQQPEDVTLKVTQLATTGDLRTIQLTNRYFPTLPEQLRRCSRMRHLSLVYTHTDTLPAWIKEYTHLEYLYVEGTFDSSLVELPPDMLDEMPSLTFIHLGMHLRLQRLPSFNGLKNLKALTLALFVSLVELPSFDNLSNLERLVLTYVPRIEILPDLKAVQKLKAFSVNDRGGWCCNGFLGECNLQDPFCAAHPFWGIPPASCLPSSRTASSETIAVVDKFPSTVCKPVESRSPGPGFPSPDTISQCDGVLYRKCHLPGVEEAMCYNARFMAIFCMPDPLVIEMRRRQIQLGVGDLCNPDQEAWLGCL